MITRQIHYSYQCPQTGVELDLYKVELAADFPLLYQWMHAPHVVSTWQLNLPQEELLQHFDQMIQIASQELFLVAINGRLIGYSEIYDVTQDRLARYYQACNGDFGIHLLIGDADSLNKGYSSLIIRALSNYLFQNKHSVRVVIEPSVTVKQLTILERKLGFKRLGNLYLPEKIATLYMTDAEQFYTANPTPITCNTHNWPIIHLHFPSFPQDEMVSRWISELDNIINRHEPYIVISTFDNNYQFSQNARKEEMYWFKRNKPLLNEYCLGMLRITRDEEMLAKLNSPAMKKGMPFRCIPCASLEEANLIALDMIKNISTSKLKAS